MRTTTILFRSLRNGEFLQLMKNILSIITQFKVVSDILSERLAELITYIQSFDEAFKPISGEELSKELKVLDTRRDRALMGIKLYLQSLLYREEEDIVNAATELLEQYELHGKRIDRLPYQQQTAVTNSLLGDYGKPNLVEAAKNISLTQWISLLGNVNNTFNTTYVERAKTITEPSALDEKRAAIKDAYQEMAEDMEAYARIGNNKEEFIKAIKAINGIINDYNQAVTNRLHGKASAEDVDIEEVINE